MLYAIFATDKENSLPGRQAAGEKHRDRLRKLAQQGRLILAGPTPAIDSPDPGPAGFSGSLIVAEFDSLDDARAWAADDPYIEAGVYDGVEIRPISPRIAMNEQRIAEIRERLTRALQPAHLEIEDDSHLHAGHAGARDGRGHFRVKVVSEAFTSKTRLERHRLVNAALSSLFETDIHALSIDALAPDESPAT